MCWGWLEVGVVPSCHQTSWPCSLANVRQYSAFVGLRLDWRLLVLSILWSASSNNGHMLNWDITRTEWFFTGTLWDLTQNNVIGACRFLATVNQRKADLMIIVRFSILSQNSGTHSPCFSSPWGLSLGNLFIDCDGAFFFEFDICIVVIKETKKVLLNHPHLHGVQERYQHSLSTNSAKLLTSKDFIGSIVEFIFHISIPHKPKIQWSDDQASCLPMFPIHT